MKCPVCSKEVDSFDICDNCGWQNNGPNGNENNLAGPNEMTLKKAREAYKKGEKIL
ncbi:MAG: CPCC family cysteine-rich protein [Clostridiaceae bacterium]